MTGKLAGFLGLMLLAAVPALAETTAPYAGWQSRDIKALSAQQIDDLRAGRGMSLALAAELNGYPGPRHVLDLGAELDLSAAQRRAFEALFDEMQGEAQRLGAAILEQEAALDHAFRSGRAADSGLRDRLARLAALQGELRYTHLRTHLRALDLLTRQQVAQYNALRGYAGEAGGEPAAGRDSHGGHGSHGGASHSVQ
jgi:Spy/CpxP family protein refolding chaperone